MIDNCYKDTGTDWLPAIPKEWQSIRFTKVYQFFKGLDIKKRDLEADGIPVLSYGQIHSKLNLAVKIIPELIRFIPENRLPVVPSERALLQAGDIVFADTSEDIAGVGNLCRVSEEDRIFAGYHTLVARPRNQYCHKYYAYLFNSEIWRQQIRQAVQGVKVFSITQSIFHSVSIIEPTPTDQDRIVAFLDSKTGEIDGLVGQLTEQRGLLERYKRELIAHTVTHGLDPDAEMKDSGIDWIGQIPAHWETVSISSLYKPRNTKVRDKDYPPLSITQKGVVPQLGTVAKTNDGDNRKLIRQGDFVINSRSDRRGACGIADRDGSCSLINTVLEPVSTFSGAYLTHLFRSSMFADEFYRWGHGIHNDLWTTGWAEMKRIMISFPPLIEQERIADFLDKKSGEIDTLVADIDREIELLQKYRKQLINDVVTGKVRVTEYAGEEA